MDIAAATYAIDNCSRLEELDGQFDIIFLDADKHNYQLYMDRLLDRRLLSPNGVIFVDNGKRSHPQIIALPFAFHASIH